MASSTRSLHERVQSLLWSETDQAPQPLRIALPALRLLFAVGRDVAGGQLTLRAMSLVYTTLLSLVPLLAISFSILKGFGVHNQIEPFLLATLEPLGERGAEISAQIIAFVDNMQVGVLGFVGFVLLFYTVLSLMQKIESAFNEVWQITRQRSMAERFRDYLSVIVVGPVLVFTSLGITASFFASQFMQELLLVGPIGTLVEVAGRLVPVVMVVIAFTFVYMFVPNTRVRVLPALTGGVVAGILWNLLGMGFAAFVAASHRFTAVYSGFATPIFFMIWLYLGWLVLLLGGNIAFYRQHPEYLAGRRVAASLSFAEREQIALGLLLVIGDRFYAGRPAASVDELSAELQAPPDVAEHLLAVLSRAGLVVPTDQQPSRYLPARPWEDATLADAFTAVRAGRNGSRAMRAGEGALPLLQQDAVAAVLGQVEAVTHEALSGTSLKAFVMASARPADAGASDATG